jgi:hypothetical protein
MSSSSSLYTCFKLPYETFHALQEPNKELGTVRNGVAVGVNSKVLTASGYDYAKETYDPDDGQLFVFITSFASGASNQTRVEDTNDGGVRYFWNFPVKPIHGINRT